VRDTGIGMSEKQVHNIFGFFTTYDKRKGYGLGLAFAQRLVGRLGPVEYIEV
jgi:signal transduction histidine kinase